jgi:hypothetical protein
MWPTAFNSQESRCESSTGEKIGLPQYTQATHKNDENSNISPCKNTIFKKIKSSKRNQNPSR